jgi:putative transposase
VLTDTGPVEISVPRDRDSSFEPKIVAKRQRRLTQHQGLKVFEAFRALSTRLSHHADQCCTGPSSSPLN